MLLTLMMESACADEAIKHSVCESDAGNTSCQLKRVEVLSVISCSDPQSWSHQQQQQPCSGTDMGGMKELQPTTAGLAGWILTVLSSWLVNRRPLTTANTHNNTHLRNYTAATRIQLLPIFFASLLSLFGRKPILSPFCVLLLWHWAERRALMNPPAPRMFPFFSSR